MDESERLSTQIALQHAVETYGATGFDLLISAFAAALKSHRRASVCRPFPAHICGLHYSRLSSVIDQLPRSTISAQHMLEYSSSASDTQLQLLQWLFLHLQLKRSCSFTMATAGQLVAELCAAGCWLSDLPQQLQACRCILTVDHGDATDKPGNHDLLYAYHGTDFANLHSILHNGLMALSGTRLQTTGAVFGSGIYLATDFNVAYAFSQTKEGWHNSAIGKHLRCVLLCQVKKSAAVQGGSAAAAAQSLPEKYILVPRPSDVVLRYLLVFSDDAMLGHTAGPAAAGRGRHGAAAVCLYITVTYVVLMLLLATWSRASSSW